TAFAEDFIDFLVVPARMAEFEGVSALSVEECNECRETFRVGFEPRRQLKQHRPGFRSEGLQTLLDQGQAVARALAQPFPVRDESRRLPGEHEVPRCARTPVAYGGERRCAVEHAIELGGDELRREISEVVLDHDLARKERPAPGSIAPARSANENPG